MPLKAEKAWLLVFKVLKLWPELWLRDYFKEAFLFHSIPYNVVLFSIRVPVYHSWQLLVVKSSIQTVERAGLLDQLSGRGNDVANQSGIISVVGKF